MAGPFSAALRERVTREITARVRREVWREAAKMTAARMRDVGRTRRQIEEELAAYWHVTRKEAARIADATFQTRPGN